MNARIELLTIGLPETVQHDGREVTTGIFKKPCDRRVSVNRLGIVGDGQADLSVHGGYDKAVYVYPEHHYRSWADELDNDALEPSQFGENLRVSGISDDAIVIGDRFRFGSVVAIVSQPRLPCFKLGIRMNDPAFPQRFLQSGRLGFYLRIEEEGETGVGDEFDLLDRPDHGITVPGLWHTVFDTVSNTDDAKRCLELLPHLDAGWQRRLRARVSGKGQKPVIPKP
jgi:MOSC domain-containing protein YiiM